MIDYWPVVAIALTIVVVVTLVVVVKVEPVIALLVSALGLGVITGQGGEGTVTTMTSGFGSVLGDIGLLIALGLLLGALLDALGVAPLLARWLVARFGRRGLPVAYALTLGVAFPSIYSDVLVVMSAPLTRLASRGMGPRGYGLLAGSSIAGMIVGVVFVVPGAAALATAGITGASLPSMLAIGAPLGIVTIVVTVLVFSVIVKRGGWDDARDLDATVSEAATAAEANGGSAAPDLALAADEDPKGSTASARRAEAVATAVATATAPRVPLGWAIAPIALTLLLIAANSLTQLVSIDAPVLQFLGDAHIALLAGLVLAYVTALRTLPAGVVSTALASALKQAGPVIILTGVSGSLAAVVGGTGAAKALTSVFDGHSLSPILLTWLIAAVLHAAIGSVSTAALTAAGIVAPLIPVLGVDPALIALAAGSGALLLGMVNANAFWLFKSVLGLSVRGTFKAYSLTLSIASVVSLLALLVAGAVV
ncbi:MULTISPECIES: GntP family permease [unclassified Rathayibacter]|uniref:GntP family permease n=1 Tax=unclassified Rathayibacter TaxID=2609250 RepID=UPI00188BFCBA|nr:MULTISPECIES: SLC13 family permease [unclassified Rathayibacter]MBF4461994.1 gluconate transporter [Rathayibacter sp. VKM Ac-2879]MBF4503963.1 gluconate transporter [Rathayibacter sp. VKM Ac-2878]